MPRYGERLKKLREEKGMKQRTLAKMSDVDKNLIRKYEMGELVFLPVEAAKRIAEVLNVSWTFFSNENVTEVHDHVEERKEIEMRDAKLVNLILDYSIENQMSMEEVDECVNRVSKVYYTDGLIRRG